MRSEQPLEPASKGVGHANAGPVCRAQRCDYPLGEVGPAQRISQLGQASFDTFVELQFRDGTLTGTFRRRQRNRPRLQLGVQHRTAGDLFPVVILGVDPEHRHRRSAMLLGRPASELDRRNSLQ